jgi:hypothetical protein
MTIPQVGNLYADKVTGMVVVAVTRYENETSLLRFPGRVVFPGRTGRWDRVGVRLDHLRPRDFTSVEHHQQPQLNLFEADRRAV